MVYVACFWAYVGLILVYFGLNWVNVGLNLSQAWKKLQPDMLVVDRGSIYFLVGRQVHPMPFDGSKHGSAEAYVSMKSISFSMKSDIHHC